VSINMKLRSEILELKPGTDRSSNTFAWGEWNPRDSPGQRLEI